MVLLKKILRRWLGNSTMPASGHSEQRSAALANSWTRWWWQTLALLDLGLYYGIWLRLQLLLGKSVICDRYLSDTQLDFQMNFRDDNVTSRPLWKCLQAICPTPTDAFMLLIPVEESLRRSAVKNEPFPDGEAALQERLQFYQTLAAQENSWRVIDGLRPIDVVAAEINTTVFGTATREAPCR
jgi:thymidylate kinase